MQQLLGLAEQIAARLKERGETVAVAESSAGGLIAAALLAVPGASAHFLGGAVVYTRHARRALLGISNEAMQALRPSTEPYALLLARTVSERHGATWGLAETGATGPTGNAYGDGRSSAWRKLGANLIVQRNRPAPLASSLSIVGACCWS
jgi:PncC family amidohydrolase